MLGTGASKVHRVHFKSIEDITLYDLWNRKKGTTHYQWYNITMFVNFNRKLKPFIRVNVAPNGSCTFDYSLRGLRTAKDYALAHIRAS